jgi:sarcosine oxidase subunit gamma
MAERITLALACAFRETARWRGNDVEVSPAAAIARWSLRLPPTAADGLGAVAGLRIAMPINRAAVAGDVFAARLGPDEWLLCSPQPAAEQFERQLAATLGTQPHALVDVSHRYAALSIEGPRAPDLLAAGCPLDLHPAAFIAGTATRTLLGKAEIVLWRLRDAPAYRVECAPSYAPYVHAFLREAGREFFQAP